MTTVKTTEAARGSPHRSRKRAAGANAKLRSIDRAKGLSTSPVKYMKAMLAKISIVSRKVSASRRVLFAVVTAGFLGTMQSTRPLPRNISMESKNNALMNPTQIGCRGPPVRGFPSTSLPELEGSEFSLRANEPQFDSADAAIGGSVGNVAVGWINTRHKTIS